MKCYIKLLLFSMILVFFAIPAFATQPDLTLTGSDISFSNLLPEPDEVITISATIHNNGGLYFDSIPYDKHDYLIGTTSGSTGIYDNYWLAVCFNPNQNIYLGKVSLLIRNNGSIDDELKVEIRDNKVGAFEPEASALIPEALLATSIIVSTSTSFEWKEFELNTQPFLSAGNTYWICLENLDSTSGDGYSWWLDAGVPTRNYLSYLVNQGTDWQTPGANYIAYYKVYKCTETVISCYQGDPDSGGTLIAVSTFTTPIPAGGSTTTNFSWTSVFGSQNIYVEADRLGIISESNEANNKTYQSITVTPTLPSIIGFSPSEDAVGRDITTPVTVSFSEEMDPTTTSNAVTVKVIKDNSGNNPENEYISGTKTFNTNTVTFSATWNKGYVYEVNVTNTASDLYGNNPAESKSWQFSTILDYAASNTYTCESNNLTVTLPPNSLDGDYYISIDTNPTSTQSISSKVSLANSKIKQSKGHLFSPISNGIQKLSVYRNGYEHSGDFENNVTISIPYSDSGNGLVQDTNGLTVKEKTLALYYLNEDKNMWLKIPNSTIDTDNNRVSANVNHFSVYAIIGGNDTDISNAYAYPVPWKPNDGLDATGTLANGITFTNLGSKATIRIFTISGELVRVLNYEYTGGNEELTWDVKNNVGDLLASGVYIYYIENDVQNKSGKLIIIK